MIQYIKSVCMCHHSDMQPPMWSGTWMTKNVRGGHFSVIKFHNSSPHNALIFPIHSHQQPRSPPCYHRLHRSLSPIRHSINKLSPKPPPSCTQATLVRSRRHGEQRISICTLECGNSEIQWAYICRYIFLSLSSFLSFSAHLQPGLVPPVNQRQIAIETTWRVRECS